MSRILGFVRDILIAAWLGTGPVAEAFLVAFALPNMFRRFFAEGAFNMAFVPMFSKKLEAGTGAPKFAADALAGLAFVVTIFTVLATIFMPWLVLAMASGFRGDERFDIAVTLGRIVFVYILFISLAALFSGVLNAAGRFVAAAAAPVLLNIILITTLIAAGSGFGTSLIGEVRGRTRRHGPVLRRRSGGHRAIGAGLVGGGACGLSAAAWPAAHDARVETPGHHRRASGAGGRRRAGEPADRTAGRQLLRRRHCLAGLCRSAVPTAAGGRGHRDRDRAAARPLPPPAGGRHRRRPTRAKPCRRDVDGACHPLCRGAGGDPRVAGRCPVRARRFRRGRHPGDGAGLRHLRVGPACLRAAKGVPTAVSSRARIRAAPSTTPSSPWW